MTHAALKDLLPCPFCGGKSAQGHEAGSWGYYPAKAWIFCCKCGARGPGFNDEERNPLSDYKGAAITAWNRRAALSAMEGEAVHFRTGVRDKSGREICAGDRIVYRNESPNTKREYWNPEYSVEWHPPMFKLRHVGGGKSSDSATFTFHYAAVDESRRNELEVIQSDTNIYTAPPPQQAGGVTEAMVERGLQAAIEASDARLPRYSVVRSILTAALAPKED